MNYLQLSGSETLSFRLGNLNYPARKLFRHIKKTGRLLRGNLPDFRLEQIADIQLQCAVLSADDSVDFR